MEQDIVRIRPDVSVTSVSESDTPDSQVLVTFNFGAELCRLAGPERSCDVALKLGSGDSVDTSTLAPEELDMISIFRERGWAVTSEPGSGGRHERQEAYFQARCPEGSGVQIQQQLAETRITIVGCGGVGSNLALLAAMSGVAGFQIIDGDRIELSNLNRQIPFSVSPESIGRPKAEHLAGLLIDSYAASAEAHCCRLDVDSADLIRQFDPNVVVIAADEPSILEVVMFAVEQFGGTPILVAGGYLGQRSYVGPFLGVRRPPCRSCLERAFGMDLEARPSRPNIGGTIGPIAVHAASQASAILIHHLTGLLPDTHPVIDGISQFDHDLGSCETRPLRCSKCSDIELDRLAMQEVERIEPVHPVGLLPAINAERDIAAQVD